MPLHLDGKSTPGPLGRDWKRTALGLEKRIAELEAALRDVRQVICEKAPDTLWVGLIETAVDRIDGVLGQK